MKKILVIIAVIIALVIAGLTVFVKTYVTSERVMAYIIPEAEKALNRKVSVGDVKINIFKGIDVRDFVIKESDGKTDFVSCENFVLKFQFWPLLSKKLIIDELRLESPSILLSRAKDGRFNYEDIGKSKKVTKPDTKKETEGAEPLPISLLISSVQINRAKLSLTDLTKELPDVTGSTDIEIAMKSLSGSDARTSGSVAIALQKVIIHKPEKREIINLTAEIDYTGTINIDSYDVTIEKADLKIAGIPLSLEGDIKGIKTSPRLNVRIQVPKTDAAKIQKAAAAFASVDDLKTSGFLSADVRIQGETKKIDALKADGAVVMDSLGIDYQGIKTVLNGRADMKNDIVNVDMTGTVGENTADLKGTVKSPFQNQNINLNVYAKKLNLDQLIAVVPSKGQETAKSSEGAKKKGADREAEPMDLKLAAQGEIKVDTALYKGLSVNNFHARYSYISNRLVISDMTGTVGKGNFSVNSEIDLSKPGYSYKLSSKINAFEAEKFVNAFFPKAKDTLFGLLAMNINLNGTGTLPSSIRKNITGTADFTLEDGKLTNTGLSEKFSGFLEMKEMETIILKDAKGTVKIKDGVARLDSLFSSDDFLMGPLGSIGLNETLDLAFDLKLAPRLTDKALSSKITKYMKNEEGWGVIPVLVTGTFANPSYKVDIEKAGKQVIKKETDKVIDKLFQKKSEEKQQELEPVKELLKGLFK